MTRRWVSPVGHDRTHPVASGGLLEMTECWGPTSGHDQTDVSGRSWNLTGSDRTLGSCVRSWHYVASGHHLTIRIGRSVFEERRHMACIARPDAGVLRLVDMTRASGRPVFSAVSSLTALFRGGFYLSLMADSSSFSWPFALT